MSSPIDPSLSKTVDAPDWEQIQASPDFGRLRRAVRNFIFPLTVAFLVWYLLYVLLADYAHGFMSTKVFGNVNIGLIFGVLQFVSTFLIAIAYSRYANRKIDPLADQIRDEAEGSAR
ncbi:DUF485 domain-containing protein [Nakamurella aerolata]|uniref:DUF485 domain-containing protein n=1 Tax=Nakamurella aerolata TaxID=1656892 RepID=A0A849ABI1_9ACTN|nr:DUF485 domain-containing protein [Nakamurella aerolata]NNG34262.1 DUF485 domain-containing protein [Nakamurella aerolata]